MICPKCQAKNFLSAKYCSSCRYEFNKEDRDNAYNKTIYGKIDRLIESVNKITGVFNLSFIFESRIFRCILLILLIIAGVYLNSNRTQYAIIPSDEYRIEYNKGLNEYYLYTDNDYVNLKLYLMKDVETITVMNVDDSDTVISNSDYRVNDQIILYRETGLHYEIIENDMSFDVYIFSNNN